MKVRKYIPLVLAILFCFSLAGCAAETALDKEYASAGDYNYSDNSYGSMSPTEAPGALADTAAGAKPEDTEAAQARKWIITVDIEAETENLDPLMEAVNQKITELGGYVENQNYRGSTGSRGRSVYLTVRIPAQYADSFTTHLSDSSNVLSNNKQLEDITLKYVATESRINALKTEEARLLELLAQAENMSDLLEIESRLTDVRYELEATTSALRVYDNQVNYATISLHISEVKKLTPVEEKSVWQRISDGFMTSLETIADGAVELMILVLAGSPYLVIVAGIGVGVYFIVRVCTRKSGKTQTPPPQWPINPPQMPPQSPEQDTRDP